MRTKIKDYIFNESDALKESDVSPDPIEQFKNWFDKSNETNQPEANTMFLATCSKNLIPSVRTVLLKSFDENGFVFFTNYSSRKGSDLNENPFASLLFFWKDMGRQIRVEGMTEKVSKEESDLYFHSRPYESQLAALASEQSSVIEGRDILEKKFNELKDKFKNNTVPLPDFWGGYGWIPDKIEFWQGRQNRLHDRILYSKENDKWKIERLAP